MSHHGGRSLPEMSEMFKELEEHQRKIAGDFPDGKLTEKDEGALSLAVSAMGEKVVLAFGEPTAWLGLTADQAANLGVLLIKRAREAGIKEPISIEL